MTRTPLSFKTILIIAAIIISPGTKAQSVDYSVVSVPEESGVDFVKISKESDYVCMPTVRRSRNGIDWFTNRILGITPDGRSIGYLSFRNGSTNIFIKNLERQGSSVQRTNRSNVIDFSYSPDGKKIVFSEKSGDCNQIFLTDAQSGYVCRQITSNDKDYSPIYSTDMRQIFFSRAEARGSGIWSYDVAKNFLSSLTNGMNPCSMKHGNALIISRLNSNGRSEIWKVDCSSGIEECIVSDPNHSYTSPTISPDGQWILFVGDRGLDTGRGQFYNTDIFVCHLDGTSFTQLTYHAADDLSPVWSADGRYIYFISQRGDAQGVANIWKMNFNY